MFLSALSGGLLGPSSPSSTPAPAQQQQQSYGGLGVLGVAISSSGPISLAPGALLSSGRYRVVRELNRGGTAVVYEALDVQSGVSVALKVMNGPEQVPIKVVKREISFSSTVQHDNIVRLLDVFAEGARLVIVWELISGADLLDLLNECGGRMPEHMAAFYFTQLLRALCFMHANGFCHRDIKPENCMVERAGHKLKLIDFGLSKHLASANTLGIGTPDYMCPELLHQQAPGGGGGFAAVGGFGGIGGSSGNRTAHQPYDARAVDAWAMGVLMYLLVTSWYPFEDSAHPNNLASTVHNVLAGRMRPLPPNVSAGCAGLIHGLLRIKPSERSTLRDLVHDPWLASAAQQYAGAVSGDASELISLLGYAEITPGRDGQLSAQRASGLSPQASMRQGHSRNGSAGAAAAAAPLQAPSLKLMTSGERACSGSHHTHASPAQVFRGFEGRASHAPAPAGPAPYGLPAHAHASGSPAGQTQPHPLSYAHKLHLPHSPPQGAVPVALAAMAKGSSLHSAAAHSSDDHSGLSYATGMEVGDEAIPDDDALTMGDDERYADAEDYSHFCGPGGSTAAPGGRSREKSSGGGSGSRASARALAGGSSRRSGSPHEQHQQQDAQSENGKLSCKMTALMKLKTLWRRL